jgi:asparagine synthase (glutamine-hydrolysing)
MCGIAGRAFVQDPRLVRRDIELMNRLQAHRGPDDEGCHIDARAGLGLGHRRLSIIGLESGHQPMSGSSGAVLVFNGEIYNYLEILEELGESLATGASDSQALLLGFERWGPAVVERLRGMFAFAIWNPHDRTLFCARDRFGIKPFQYHRGDDGSFTFASEIKAILPFIERPRIDEVALQQYLTFQFCLSGRTLYAGIEELPPATAMIVREDGVRSWKYWEVEHEVDWHHTPRWFEEELRARLDDSLELHLRADVPLGAYVSGGIDSTGIASMARDRDPELLGFNGSFSEGNEFDESSYARLASERSGFPLIERRITESDFISNIGTVIEHLDQPLAGPGSFPQFMISEEAARHRKVVLGGQGGDEIFGGYTRYLIAYFEQCIKAAIDGTSNNGNFVLTYESIIPALPSLKAYKPLIKSFWSDGVFEDLDRRYFKMVNRAPQAGPLVRWEAMEPHDVWPDFEQIFNAPNLRNGSYLDRMSHFDMKTLLPALLHVEDRMSMAHGLESRVPLLDHPLVELAATVPADIKFRNGDLKHLLKKLMRPSLPPEVMDRKDKMGFPVPLNDWIGRPGPTREFALDILGSSAAADREYFDNRRVVEGLGGEHRYGRTLWGMLSLELWQRRFFDGHRTADSLARNADPVAGGTALTTERD